MKRILVIGIVLLALLALTGVVSATTEGKMSVAGDVVPRNLELQVNCGIGGWTLSGGDNTFIGSGCIVVNNNGFAEGYTVTVADKMDVDSYHNAKAELTEGHMVIYKTGTYATWNWLDLPGTGTYLGLTNPLHILNGMGSDIALSGVDQILYTTNEDGHGSPVTYSPTFKQSITTTDRRASYVYYDATGYLIIITVTATPN